LDGWGLLHTPPFPPPLLAHHLSFARKPSSSSHTTHSLVLFILHNHTHTLLVHLFVASKPWGRGKSLGRVGGGRRQGEKRKGRMTMMLLLLVLVREDAWTCVSPPLLHHHPLSSLPYSKPAGSNAGRKLRVHRRNEKWASKTWNKAHSVTHMKANPLGGAAMAKGIVLEKM